MKFINFSISIFFAIALISVILGSISSANLKKNEALESTDRRQSKHIFRNQLNPPYKNVTNYTLGYTFNNAINNSYTSITMKDFKHMNLNAKFHSIYDKELEEIFLILKKGKFQGIDDFRSAYELFIENFNKCDKNNDNLLDVNEFSACMTSDPYLSIIQEPTPLYSTYKNYTNSSAFYQEVYTFASNYDEKGLNFYDYIIIRFFNWAWRKCGVANRFMDETTFECAVDLTSGTKSLNSKTLRNVFYLALKLTNSNYMPVRTVDFVSYFALASSIRLFGRINAKENFDASIGEFNIALDNNILPTRYNQDIINQLFRLIKKNSSVKMGIDLLTFTFYDHYLKFFYQGATKNRWTINSDEFAKICTGFMFPKFIHNYLTHVPTANFTSNDYNLRAHLNKVHWDEEDNFAKFLEVSNRRYNNTLYNKKIVDQRIFNLLDSNNNNFLTFYDFGNFIQILTLYGKLDNRDADRVIVSDLFKGFTEYSDLPVYSSEFNTRGHRFALLEQDFYIDPFFALVVARIDDFVSHYVRREDPSTVKEIELQLIFSKMNMKHFPVAFIERCSRGKDSNGIPKYDWECAISEAINRSLKYLEYSRDVKDIKDHGFNLTYTSYDYPSSK